ncbi:hypothetical protein ERS070151_00180 [Streptococcus pneumoniae]|nr:hypothetical protein ERS070151_00180 [Streptococcus pneumoniae]
MNKKKMILTSLASVAILGAGFVVVSRKPLAMLVVP